MVFRRKRRTFTPNLAETVIAHHVEMRGDIESDNDVWIDGTLDGDISTLGNVTVGINAHITGDIHASTVNVAGTVVGNITTKEQLTLSESAHLRGNLKAPSLQIDHGAVLNGTVVIPTDDDTTTAVKDEAPEQG